jgi:PAS domain S-box-containing protein
MIRWSVLIAPISQTLSGLRFRLLLLVLLVCIPLAGLMLLTASEARGRERANWSQRLERIQQLANGEEARLLGQTRQVLLALSEAATVRSGNERGCQRLLDEVFSISPSYANLAVLTTNADVLASVRPLNEAGDHPDLRVFRQVLQRRRFAIGKCPPPPGCAKPVVHVGFPASDRRGQVQAVVLAVLDPNWCNRSLSDLKVRLPAAASLTEADESGAILAHYPPPGPAKVQLVVEQPVLEAARAQSRGTVESRDSKGVLGCYAFAKRHSELLGTDVITILGIPEEALFSGANRQLGRNLTSLGIAFALALALGWAGSQVLVIRPLRTLVGVSARLAAGDLSTRSGLRHGNDELGQLSRNLDQMAEALQERERQRQLAEEMLRTRDHVMRQLPLFPAAVCVCDEFGAVQLYNRAAVDLWGYEPPDPHAGQSFCGSYLLFHPDGRPMPRSESPMAEVLRTGVQLQNRELVVGRPDGTRVPVLASVVPLLDGEGSLIGAVSCLQDISERKRAEERLQESHDKLQLLSRRLVESQETERRHIARELHDEVGQTLTVAEMNLQAVMNSPSASRLREHLNLSLQAVGRVLGQVRDLSLSLRPSMLDDLGLEPALRWYTRQQAGLIGMQVAFEADPLDDRLDAIIETACFRVAQEALTNVARHALARSVNVSLRREDSRLHLVVRDDGVGFDVGALRQRAVLGASLGLLSMEERATLVEGCLELKSAPGQGTEVHAWFPLKWRAPES